jgi:hypothetical protein
MKPGEAPADARMRSAGRGSGRSGIGPYREERRIATGLTEMCQREAYFRLKKEVHVLATEVARSVILDSRSYSLWLLKVKGFPWRDECKWKS